MTVVIHYSFIQSGVAIKAKKYCQFIGEMHEKWKLVQTSLVNRHDPILLYDIAKLNKLKYEISQHPLNLPDLSPTDFYFFSDCHHFGTV